MNFTLVTDMAAEKEQEQTKKNGYLPDGQRIQCVIFPDESVITEGQEGCNTLVIHRDNESAGPAEVFVVDTRDDGSVFLHNIRTIAGVKLSAIDIAAEDEINASLIGRLENYIHRGHSTDPMCLEHVRTRMIELAGFIQAECPNCGGTGKDETNTDDSGKCGFCLGRGVITDKEVDDGPS